jgi:hypothetical protein
MGRGRAKAKQTRVARELKYHSPNTDLAALQRELASSGRKPSEEELAKYGDSLETDDDEEDDDEDEVDDPAVGYDPPRRR